MYSQNDLDNMTHDEKTEVIYDTLADLGIATHEELELVTGVSGYNLRTMENVLYYKIGSYELAHLLEEYGLFIEEGY